MSPTSKKMIGLSASCANGSRALPYVRRPRHVVSGEVSRNAADGVVQRRQIRARSAHVTGVSEGIATRLWPYRESVRFRAYLDDAGVAVGGVDRAAMTCWRAGFRSLAVAGASRRHAAPGRRARRSDYQAMRRSKTKFGAGGPRVFAESASLAASSCAARSGATAGRHGGG